MWKWGWDCCQDCTGTGTPPTAGCPFGNCTLLPERLDIAMSGWGGTACYNCADNLNGTFRTDILTDDAVSLCLWIYAAADNFPVSCEGTGTSIGTGSDALWTFTLTVSLGSTNVVELRIDFTDDLSVDRGNIIFDRSITPQGDCLGPWAMSYKSHTFGNCGNPPSPTITITAAT